MPSAPRSAPEQKGGAERRGQYHSGANCDLRPILANASTKKRPDNMPDGHNESGPSTDAYGQSPGSHSRMCNEARCGETVRVIASETGATSEMVREYLKAHVRRFFQNRPPCDFEMYSRVFNCRRADGVSITARSVRDIEDGNRARHRSIGSWNFHESGWKMHLPRWQDVTHSFSSRRG